MQFVIYSGKHSDAVERGHMPDSQIQEFVRDLKAAGIIALITLDNGTSIDLELLYNNEIWIEVFDTEMSGAVVTRDVAIQIIIKLLDLDPSSAKYKCINIPVIWEY